MGSVSVGGVGGAVQEQPQMQKKTSRRSLWPDAVTWPRETLSLHSFVGRILLGLYLTRFTGGCILTLTLNHFDSFRFAALFNWHRERETDGLTIGTRHAV